MSEDRSQHHPKRTSRAKSACSLVRTRTKDLLIKSCSGMTAAGRIRTTDVDQTAADNGKGKRRGSTSAPDVPRRADLQQAKGDAVKEREDSYSSAVDLEFQAADLDVYAPGFYTEGRLLISVGLCT